MTASLVIPPILNPKDLGEEDAFQLGGEIANLVKFRVRLVKLTIDGKITPRSFTALYPEYSKKSRELLKAKERLLKVLEGRLRDLRSQLTLNEEAKKEVEEVFRRLGLGRRGYERKVAELEAAISQSRGQIVAIEQSLKGLGSAANALPAPQVEEVGRDIGYSLSRVAQLTPHGIKEPLIEKAASDLRSFEGEFGGSTPTPQFDEKTLNLIAQTFAEILTPRGVRGVGVFEALTGRPLLIATSEAVRVHPERGEFEEVTRGLRGTVRRASRVGEDYIVTLYINPALRNHPLIQLGQTFLGFIAASQIGKRREGLG